MKNKKKHNWKFEYEDATQDIIHSAKTEKEAIDCAVTLCKFLAPHLKVNINSFKKIKN